MKIFDAENYFYLHCEPNRLSKFLAHAKLYEQSLNLPGDFLETGVFKGASFCRFRKLGKLFHPDHSRKFYGFDVFGEFPQADYERDEAELRRQIAEDGGRGIDRDELMTLLRSQSLAENVTLIKGDVRQTVPEFLSKNEQVSFSIVNVDLDLYGPILATLQAVFPRIVKGGVLILDDYEGFPGAKKAVDEYFESIKVKVKIQKYAFSLSPCYIVKE